VILVTAPTSTIGRRLVTDLLDHDVALRVVARDPRRLDPDVSDRVEVVTGSHGDPDAIDRAADGVAAAFWLTPNIPSAPTLEASFADFARPAAAAFARHELGRVVGVSALGRGTPLAAHAGAVTASLAMDDVLAASGVPYRAVVCPSFMHNLLNHVGAMRDQGAFFMTIDPELSAPTVAARDIAATAVGLLLDDTWTGAGEVACLGPEDLTPVQMARIISDVTGHEIRYVQIPGAAFKERMLGLGMSEAMADGLLDMFDAKNRGLDRAVARTAASTTPTTLRQWCAEVLRPALG
jgi:uncharacterized protein YbjT (DUF2867 family)